MKYANKIKKMLPAISNAIKQMGGGVPATFNELDKLPYVYYDLEFNSAQNDGNVEYYYTMYTNLINVNGFYYPAEIFKEAKIKKDDFEGTTTYNIYLKDKYSKYASERDNSIVLNNLSLEDKKKIALSSKIENFIDKRKVGISKPSNMAMIEGLENPFKIL